MPCYYLVKEGSKGEIMKNSLKNGLIVGALGCAFVFATPMLAGCGEGEKIKQLEDRVTSLCSDVDTLSAQNSTYEQQINSLNKEVNILNKLNKPVVSIFREICSIVKDFEFSGEGTSPAWFDFDKDWAENVLSFTNPENTKEFLVGKTYAYKLDKVQLSSQLTYTYKFKLSYEDGKYIIDYKKTDAHISANDVAGFNRFAISYVNGEVTQIDHYSIESDGILNSTCTIGEDGNCSDFTEAKNSTSDVIAKYRAIENELTNAEIVDTYNAAEISA